MLVLSRKVGERILLDVPRAKFDKRVIVKVLEIHGKQVKIGVEADSEVLVYRLEDVKDKSK